MNNENESIMSNSIANNRYESVTTTTTTTNHDMSVSGSFNDSGVGSFRSASKSSHFKENYERTVKKSKSRSRSRSRLRTRAGSSRYDNRRFDYESSSRNTHSLRHRLSYNYRPEHQRQHRQHQHHQHNYQPYYHNNNNHHHHQHQNQNFQNYYHQEYKQQNSDSYNRSYQSSSRARSPLPPAPNSDLNDQVSENRVLAVFGLDLKVTDDDLNAVFKRYGCTSCRVIRNNRMGASKGYGFVYFDSIEEAVIAKRYTHGLRILSKEIRVDFSLGVRDPLTNRISSNATFASPDSTSNPIANRLPHTTRQYTTNEFSSSSSTQIYNTHSPDHSNHHQPLRDYSPHRSPPNSNTNINTNFLQACMPLLLLHACKLLN